MGKLIFVLGGARSGKSTYACRLAQQHGGQVAFIATATPGDAEMSARILKHQLERPKGWITREIPYGIAGMLKSTPLEADIIVLDCITLLVTNLLLEGSRAEIDEEAAAAKVELETSELLAVIQQSGADWIVVSNEVGLGLVPPYPLGRIFRELLGRANQQLAAAATEVLWMVAGIPVPIHQYRPMK
jgi:adenosylcobinamide kinase/adenosylcobinamide-phosphate guanylyltransferase